MSLVVDGSIERWAWYLWMLEAGREFNNTKQETLLDSQFTEDVCCVAVEAICDEFLVNEAVDVDEEVVAEEVVDVEECAPYDGRGPPSVGCFLLAG